MLALVSAMSARGMASVFQLAIRNVTHFDLGS